MGAQTLLSMVISTHALREEGDRATASLVDIETGISTHALREEGDGGDAIANAGDVNFYPRPPRGGRPIRGFITLPDALFLPTPSARRATHRTRVI